MITLNATAPADLTDDAHFGLAVSLDGNLSVIGAPDQNLSQGAVYLYTFSNQDGGFLVGKITAIDAQNNAQFGDSVAIKGDLIVVGAPHFNEQKGKVYFYKLDINGTTLVATIEDPLGSPQSYFGSSVAIAGDKIFIGARGFNKPAADSGAVYIYKIDNITSPTSVTLLDIVQSYDIAGSDRFGLKIASDTNGSKVYIGAPQKNSSAGAIYEFKTDPDEPGL